MRKLLIATALSAPFFVSAPVSADVPGCHAGSKCDKLCQDAVAQQQYPTMAACKAHWGPVNKARHQALRAAGFKGRFGQ